MSESRARVDGRMSPDVIERIQAEELRPVTDPTRPQAAAIIEVVR